VRAALSLGSVVAYSNPVATAPGSVSVAGLYVHVAYSNPVATATGSEGGSIELCG